MLLVVSALKGLALEATDGRIGTVRDVLFDDRSWKVRWLVADTGGWLSGRRVLIHPSAVGSTDYGHAGLTVALTKAQVEASPDIQEDAPFSEQQERHLYDYYGWDPAWGGTYLGAGAMAAPFSPAPYFGTTAGLTLDGDGQEEKGDPHLRSADEISGYHIHATDADVGHVESFIMDDQGWHIRYLIADTRNWWPGQHVLLSPHAVTDIRWSDRQVVVSVSKSQIETSPVWDPAAMIEESYQKRLHGHYGWPGEGV